MAQNPIPQTLCLLARWLPRPPCPPGQVASLGQMHACCSCRLCLLTLCRLLGLGGVTSQPSESMSALLALTSFVLLPQGEAEAAAPARTGGKRLAKRGQHSHVGASEQEASPSWTQQGSQGHVMAQG